MLKYTIRLKIVLIIIHNLHQKSLNPVLTLFFLITDAKDKFTFLYRFVKNVNTSLVPKLSCTEGATSGEASWTNGEVLYR